MKTKPINLILLGDPASGKATQADRFAKRYHLYNLDMGNEVRRHGIREKFDYAHTTAIGKLTPTAIVGKIFDHILSNVPANKGILFNGTPKMINEAKLVARLLEQSGRTAPLVIYLSIPAAETLRRIGGRHVKVKGKLVKRDDDNARALANRRKYYKEQVSQVVAFFKKKYTFRGISGMGSETEVEKMIESAIANHIKNITHGS
jgi:adenylate kinase